MPSQLPKKSSKSTHPSKAAKTGVVTVVPTAAGPRTARFGQTLMVVNDGGGSHRSSHSTHHSTHGSQSKSHHSSSGNYLKSSSRSDTHHSSLGTRQPTVMTGALHPTSSGSVHHSSSRSRSVHPSAATRPGGMTNNAGLVPYNGDSPPTPSRHSSRSQTMMPFGMQDTRRPTHASAQVMAPNHHMPQDMEPRRSAPGAANVEYEYEYVRVRVRYSAQDDERYD